jgi:hypothetical protein
MSVAGEMGMMGMAMGVMMMPLGFGRGFADAPTEQKSCGDDRLRRTRPG